MSAYAARGCSDRQVVRLHTGRPSKSKARSARSAPKARVEGRHLGHRFDIWACAFSSARLVVGERMQAFTRHASGRDSTVKAVLFLILTTALACGASEPVTTRNSELTHGNVQMNLEVGVTTQTNVLEVFGAPNITSIDGSGREVWTYQRHATVSQSKSRSGYFTIIIAGGSSGRSSSQQSTRTITLIIKFDENGVVSDFNSRTSNF